MIDIGSLYAPLLVFLGAVGQALLLLFVSGVIAALIGGLLTLADIAGGRLVRIPIGIYSWLAQTTPPLILLFLAFYGPSALGWFIRPMTAAIIAFAFFAAAYYYEIFRAAFNGVPRDQFEAALALGIPPHRFALRVVIPQMARIAAGPFIGRTTVLFKETSLASAISVGEIMNASSGFIYSGANPLTMIALAGMIYATINLSMLALESRLSARRGAAW